MQRTERKSSQLQGLYVLYISYLSYEIVFMLREAARFFSYQYLYSSLVILHRLHRLIMALVTAVAVILGYRNNLKEFPKIHPLVCGHMNPHYLHNL